MCSFSCMRSIPLSQDSCAIVGRIILPAVGDCNSLGESRGFEIVCRAGIFAFPDSCIVSVVNWLLFCFVLLCPAFLYLNLHVETIDRNRGVGEIYPVLN